MPLLLPLPIHAQSGVMSRTADTLRVAFHSKPKLVFGFDSKQTFISRRNVNIAGGRAGINFNDRIRFYVGYYFLSTGYYRNLVQGADTLNAKLHLSWFALSVEWVFYRSKRWEFALPVYLGGGWNDLALLDRRFILPTEVNLLVSYKVLNWLGLGAGVGYRWLAVKNPSVPENFNTPVYSVGIRFYFSEFIQSIKDRSWEKTFKKIKELPATEPSVP